jgi:hypothetical protein
LLFAAAFVSFANPGAAQATPPATQSTPPAATTPPPPPGVDAQLDSARAVRGANLEVSLYTFGPGNAVFERFGHNALVIRDTASGRSFAYNWGMFDFDQPNFLGRFLMGDSRYWLAVFETPALVGAYREENRSIRVQRLALTPVERGALFDFVRWNSQGDNVFYRYDYYNDNCSTRVRDALDRVLLGQLRVRLSEPGIGRTWRSETERLLAGSLPVYAGIQVALGRGADVPLSKWQESFLPEHLAHSIANIAVTSSDGNRVRLVSNDTELFRAERRPMPSEPPQWLSMGLLLGLMLSGLIALLADSRRSISRMILGAAVMVWYTIIGVGGTALLLAATITKHAPYMGSNTTLFVVNPLALFAAVLVPMALWRYQRSSAALGVASAIAILSSVAVLLQFVPGFRQHNGLVLAVAVPVHIALAFAVYRLNVVAPRTR